MSNPGWHVRIRRNFKPASLLYHALAISLSALFIVPLLWMVSGSLRKVGLPPPQIVEWIPDPIAWGNYAVLSEMIPLATFVKNSLIVALAGVAVTLVVASWTGFAMAQLSSRLQRLFTTLCILLLMTPVTALWLTRFILYKELGLINSFGALIAPALMGSSALFVLLFYWTYRRVPNELFESARMDGAEAFQIWWSIAIPLARPTLLAVGVLTFVHYWSDFIDPLLYLKSESRYTLAVGLRVLQQLDITNWSLLMAGATVMTLPVLLGYALVQRFHWLEGRLSGLQGR